MLLAVAGVTALASGAARGQVSSVNLDFNAVGGGAGGSGFEAAYGLNSAGYLVNNGGDGKLSLLTLPGDTYGGYEGDPDNAQNMFYTSMTTGPRTVVEARLNALNLNQNFHGGGIWMGTDQDHYIRLGTIFNSFEGGAALEALRENEDRWDTGGQYPNRPGFDIESRYLNLSDHATPASSGVSGAVDVNNVILRLVRDRNAVAAYISFDNGATFTRSGGADYSFNALATDATSLPIDNRTTADPTNTDLTSHTVEGGFKVGAYALGGGTSGAVLQFDSFRAISGTPTWTAAGNGDWTSDANWSNGNGIGAPTNIESTAIFGPQTAARTVNVPSDIVATNVTLDSANAYTISGTGTVRFDWFYFPSHPNYYTNGPGKVTVTQGSHTISAPTLVAHKHDFDIAAGASLTLSNFGGGVTGNADAGVRKLGAGTIRVNQLNVPNVDVQAGTLQITATGTAGAVSRVSSVNVVTTAGSTAKLDITNNGLVLDYDAAATSPLAAVTALITSGRGSGGTWNGPGITSSTAAANTRFGVGVVESSALPTVPAYFGTTDGSALLIRNTYLGDTNLDGTVAFADLLALAKNYNGTGKTWVQGDSDYNGKVEFADLLSLAKNYNQTLSASQADLVGVAVSADFALAQSLVPEPTALLGLLAGLPLMRRRR